MKKKKMKLGKSPEEKISATGCGECQKWCEHKINIFPVDQKVFHIFVQIYTYRQNTCSQHKLYRYIIYSITSRSIVFTCSTSFFFFCFDRSQSKRYRNEEGKKSERTRKLLLLGGSYFKKKKKTLINNNYKIRNLALILLSCLF